MQNRGVGSTRRNGAVSDIITFNAGAEVKDSFNNTLASTNGNGQGANYIFKSLDGEVNCRLQLSDLKGVLSTATR